MTAAEETLPVFLSLKTNSVWDEGPDRPMTEAVAFASTAGKLMASRTAHKPDVSD